MIRLLLVEDSKVQSEMLQFLIEESGAFEIIGIVEDGEAAVAEVARLRPDIVLMDFHMPKLDGIGATRMIMQQHPTPIVIMSATSASGSAAPAFQALAEGALAFVRKPIAIASPNFDRDVEAMIRTLRLMSDVKVVGRRRGAPRARVPGKRGEPARALRAIGVVGSTGAPAVFEELLAGLGAGQPPVLIVQHMSPGFVESFATWLASRTGVTVELAQHEHVAQRGHAYIAPDDWHLGITPRGNLQLSQDAADDGFRPSATYLLRSLARSFGPLAMGVVLTGMGRDGAAGMLELHRAGGITVAQSEESCVVYGMPLEAVRIGAVQHVLPPAEIAALIRKQGLRAPDAGETSG